MAGIGFELRRLFGGQGLLNSFRAYAYSSMTTVGPMILCMGTIVFMQRFMIMADSPYLERQLFLATVVYCFIFSVLITGGLSMIVTRVYFGYDLSEKIRASAVFLLWGDCNGITDRIACCMAIFTECISWNRLQNCCLSILLRINYHLAAVGALICA